MYVFKYMSKGEAFHRVFMNALRQFYEELRRRETVSADEHVATEDAAPERLRSAGDMANEKTLKTDEQGSQDRLSRKTRTVRAKRAGRGSRKQTI